MADEIIEELWAIKDTLAKEADYDVEKLVELVQARRDQREKNGADLIDQQTRK
jgi:hypothetical protein